MGDKIDVHLAYDELGNWLTLDSIRKWPFDLPTTQLAHLFQAIAPFRPPVGCFEGLL